MCYWIYREEGGYTFIWFIIDTDANINCFTLFKKDTDCFVTGDLYNKCYKKWRVPIHNGQLWSQTLKEKSNPEYTWTEYAGSVKFNGNIREVHTEIPIKYYKDQCCEHMIRYGMWSVFSLKTIANKKRIGILFPAVLVSFGTFGTPFWEPS